MGMIEVTKNIVFQVEGYEGSPVTDDSLFVIYTPDEVTEDMVRDFFTKARFHVCDVYEVEDDMMQYYCIDGRLWLDTIQKLENFKKAIS